MKNNHHKTVLLTGASRGLGLALARALAKEKWHLILDARGADALLEVQALLEKETKVAAIPGDVQDENHLTALAQQAAAWGGVDVVINNASTLGLSPQPALLDYPVAILADIFRTNVLAPLSLLQKLKPHLRDNARILNVSSDAGREAYAGWGGYGSSKAALEQLSAILAAENPQWKVYWVDPGDMRTQMHQEAFPGEDISDRPLPEAVVPGFLPLIAGNLPSGRYRAADLISQSLLKEEA